MIASIDIMATPDVRPEATVGNAKPSDSTQSSDFAQALHEASKDDSSSKPKAQSKQESEDDQSKSETQGEPVVKTEGNQDAAQAMAASVAAAQGVVVPVSIPVQLVAGATQTEAMGKDSNAAQVQQTAGPKTPALETLVQSASVSLVTEDLVETPGMQVSANTQTQTQFGVDIQSQLQTLTENGEVVAEAMAPESKASNVETAKPTEQVAQAAQKSTWNVADLLAVKQQTEQIDSAAADTADNAPASISAKEAFLMAAQSKGASVQVVSQDTVQSTDAQVDLTVLNTATGMVMAVGSDTTQNQTQDDSGSSSQDPSNALVSTLGSATGTAPTNQSTFAAAVKDVAASPAPIEQKVIDQVVREVRLQHTGDRSDIVVRLTPPQLGTINIRITQDATGVSSQIQTSSEHVRTMLQAHMPALVEALSDAGLKMDRVAVTTGASFGSMTQDTGFGAAGQETQQQRRSYQSGNFVGQNPTITAAFAAAQSAEPTSHSWLA